jgi:hypothetical protein
MGDNTKMGRLAGTEELHAKQQEAARKEAERAARMRRGGSPYNALSEVCSLGRMSAASGPRARVTPIILD